jgi:hypothetical protein
VKKDGMKNGAAFLGIQDEGTVRRARVILIAIALTATTPIG